MKSTTKPLLIAALLACTSLCASAQTSTAPQGFGMREHAARDPAKMQAMLARRQIELKAKLNLSSAQECAWNNFVAALQPPSGMTTGRVPEQRRKMHEEMEKLSTPERIDRMNTMKAQRDAEMGKRSEETRLFYAALTPEQQKVIDANTVRRGHGGRDGTGHRKVLESS